MTNESKRDWGKFFEPEDFHAINYFHEQANLYGLCAQIANRIIREELEKAPRVYGAILGKECGGYFNGWYGTNSVADTHTARLIQIEEIK